MSILELNLRLGIISQDKITCWEGARDNHDMFQLHLNNDYSQDTYQQYALEISNIKEDQYL